MGLGFVQATSNAVELQTKTVNREMRFMVTFLLLLKVIREGSSVIVTC